jgi:hypothetical protein
MDDCPACKNGEENQMAHMDPGGCLFDDSEDEFDVSSTVIYCDMDGVLVDFVTGAIELCTSILNGAACTYMAVDHLYESKTVKEITSLLGEDWRPETKEDLDIPPVRKLMFSAISSAPGDFFANLFPLDDGVTELWSYLNSLGMTVNLLTAPIHRKKSSPDVGSSGEGKVDWAVRWLYPPPSDIIIRPAREKSVFAVSESGIPNILIDDRSETIDDWKSRGGIGVLHTPGDSASTLKMLNILYL